jgi:hypothetical protein
LVNIDLALRLPPDSVDYREAGRLAAASLVLEGLQRHSVSEETLLVTAGALAGCEAELERALVLRRAQLVEVRA